MYGSAEHGDVVLKHLWYVIAERHEPDLMCQLLRTQVDGNDDVVNEHWQDVEGIVTLITEERRWVDEDGLAVGVVDTRTRLVVRRYEDPEGNGSPVGFEPLVIDPTGEDVGGIGDYRTLRFVRRIDADVERHESQEARRAERIEKIRHDAAQIMLEMFVAEHLERTVVESEYVRLPDAYDAYITWCDARLTRHAYRFEFHEFVRTLPDVGWAPSDTPRVIGDRHEYVIERAHLLNR